MGRRRAKRDAHTPRRTHTHTHTLTRQALIDHPTEIRRMESFKRMTLTDFKIDIPRLANKKTLKAALESAGER